jgi:hypothetical protein
VGHIGFLGPLGSSDKGGAGAGRLAFTDRASLTDLVHEEKRIFLPLHFPYNTEVKIILGKILRGLRKLCEFS